MTCLQIVLLKLLLSLQKQSLFIIQPHKSCEFRLVRMVKGQHFPRSTLPVIRTNLIGGSEFNFSLKKERNRRPIEMEQDSEPDFYGKRMLAGPEWGRGAETAAFPSLVINSFIFFRLTKPTR